MEEWAGLVQWLGALGRRTGCADGVCYPGLAEKLGIFTGFACAMGDAHGFQRHKLSGEEYRWSDAEVTGAGPDGGVVEAFVRMEMPKRKHTFASG